MARELGMTVTTGHLKEFYMHLQLIYWIKKKSTGDLSGTSQ